MADERDEIRHRVNIVDLVGQRVSLKKRGKRWEGLCPFHDDKHPSFTVSEDTGTYRCWACGAWGDIFDWVMKTQNVDFAEALALLAQQAGVELRSRGQKKPPGERETQDRIMAEAVAYFKENLSRHRPALDYCASRGLTQKVLEAWDIGFAPAVDAGLAERLAAKKLGLPLAKDLYVVAQDGTGGYFDRFKGRLMFPIRDERGKWVAFGGRILGDGQPKYINSGDTPLFKKKRVLYGLFQARDALSQGKPAVLVEGYLDVIACHVAGVDSAVASLGTALTEDQAKLLRRFTEEVVILYDGDEAGLKAAESGCAVLAEAGLRVSVCDLPPGQDPDSLVKARGPTGLDEALAAAVEPIVFRVSLVERRVHPDSQEFWPSIYRVLATSDNPSLVERMATILAGKYLPHQSSTQAVSTLLNEVRRLRSGKKPVQRQAASTKPTLPKQPSMSQAEIGVLHAFVEEPLRERAYSSLKRESLWFSAAAQECRAAILDAFPERPPSGPPREWMHAIESDDHRRALTDIAAREETVNERYLDGCVAKLETQAEQRRIDELKSGQEGDERLQAIMEKLATIKTPRE